MMERSCFGVSPPDADAGAAIGSGKAVRAVEGPSGSFWRGSGRDSGGVGVLFPAFGFGGGMVEEEGNGMGFSALGLEA
jgi:hypothetical protein